MVKAGAVYVREGGSLERTSRAWKLPVPPLGKLVLLAVADRGDIHPHLIAQATGVPESDVRILLDALELEGFLVP